MTNKQNVLNSYPKAKLLRTKDWGKDLDRLYIVCWPNQSMAAMYGYAHSAREAWQKAWEQIQIDMVDRLAK